VAKTKQEKVIKEENQECSESIKDNQPHRTPIGQSSKFKHEYCEDLIRWFKAGNSYTPFALEVGVNPDTLYQWEKDYPEWKEAKASAMVAGKKWLEDKLAIKLGEFRRGGANPKDIDLGCLLFALKTRYWKDYGDKSKLELDATDDAKEMIQLAYKKKSNE
jgi:hypothetical protein